MGKYPDDLRETIARNIREFRCKKFPGRGGGKKCAEAFGVSPQQWSPWERGKRTPDEERLVEIAKFFETTVEILRRDNRQPEPSAESATENGEFARQESIDQEPPPGSPESFFLLAHYFINYLMKYGLVIRVDNGYLPPPPWQRNVPGQPPGPTRQ